MNCFYTGIQELYYQSVLKLSNNINVSFEFFPPKTDDMKNVFWAAIEKLSLLKPVFVSITHGINSGTYDYRCSFFKEIRERTGLIVVPHLTCSGVTLEELKDIAKKYWDHGIRHIVALRGDKLNECNKSIYAVDLVILLKQVGDFDISVAAYPEVHPEAISAQSDLINLKKKVDAGANRAITQFFFHVEKYLRFRDLCVSSGIAIPIIPGIFPIFNFCQLQGFLKLTGVSLPRWIFKVFNCLNFDLEIQKMIGVVISMEMIKILIYEGVRDFHFYTLNRFELTYAICSMLGLLSKKT